MSVAGEFSADKSILGFKYQIRYALYLLLETVKSHGFDVGVALERIDDIDIQVAGKITNVVQTKDTATVLTNSSAPLWKTLRIWSVAIKTGIINLNELSSFCLVCTSSASTDDDGVVALIQKGDADSRRSALSKLRAIANAKRNQRTLGVAYAAFADLEAQLQQDLINKVSIKTKAPTFEQLDQLIMRQIVQSPPGKQDVYCKVLFGRWEVLVEEYLRKKNTAVIAWEDINSVLWQISKEFQDDNLPTVFEGMIRNAFPEPVDSSRTFIRQLVAIGANPTLINQAHHSYLYADQLISFWLRDVIIRPDEVLAHADRLVNECEMQHAFAKADPVLSNATAEQVGMSIYRWASTAASLQEQFRLRPRCLDAEVVRGSFHDLADFPRIGWHPDWPKIFSVSRETT